MTLYLLNVADRERQIRFLKRLEKEREEEMEKPQIYILVEGGVVREVRVAGIEAPKVTVFDRDDVFDLGMPAKEAEKELYGMTWDEACEMSKEAV